MYSILNTPILLLGYIFLQTFYYISQKKEPFIRRAPQFIHNISELDPACISSAHLDLQPQNNDKNADFANQSLYMGLDL